MTPRRKKKKNELVGDPTVCCEGCGQLADKCHNVKFGRYCVEDVCAYYYTNKELVIKPLELVARKVFIDHYHYTSHYEDFCQDDKCATFGEVQWKDIPLCLKEHCYDDVMGFFCEIRVVNGLILRRRKAKYLQLG